MAVVMGTAGHIDHGKTTLVRALTGIDCDRLVEEKRRGITIELGFAHCDLPGGGRLGIVDVPGHEKFVKNMVAGASGIDFVMLVIAADEGVMPQTREHLEICSLLGIRHGFVALTKVDMVDPEWLELAMDDVRGFLAGTFLEGAPLFSVSATTGQGLDVVRAHMADLERTLTPKRRTDLFRLPVDRVFTMKGHGTVVTGTMISGQVKVGDNLVLLPAGHPTRARGLQSHGGTVDVADSGKRTAVNLHGLDVEDVQRGDVLALPGTLFPSERWIVRLTCLGSSPRALRHRVEIHFHHGSRELAARLFFFDRDRLAPGETALCEVRFEAPLVGVFGDFCVVRAFSPLRTVAGGVVLHPLDSAPRRRDIPEGVRAALLALPEADEVARVRTQVNLAGRRGVSAAELSVLTNLDSKRLDKAVQALSGKQAFCFDREERGYVGVEAVEALCASAVQQADAFHRKEPLKPGMARGAVSAGWGQKLSPKLVFFIVERLVRSGELVAEGDIVRRPSHTVSLGGGQADLKNALLAAHEKAGMAPPNFKDVVEELKADPKNALAVVKVLTDEGSLVKVKDGLYYHAPVLDGIRQQVRGWFADHDDLDPASLRELLGGLSRKFTVALLEHFDKERFTIRVGDKRQLRGK